MYSGENSKNWTEQQQKKKSRTVGRFVKHNPHILGDASMQRRILLLSVKRQQV